MLNPSYLLSTIHSPLKTMQATFEARKGNIGYYEHFCNDYASTYIWSNYSIDDFKKKWPVSKFKEFENNQLLVEIKY